MVRGATSRALLINCLQTVFALLLSAIFPAPLYATHIGAVTVTIMLVFSSFVIQTNRVPDPWVWGVYTNPVHYAYDSLALNDLHDQSFVCTTSELVPPPGANFPVGVIATATQVCPFTSGDQFLANQDLSTHWWHRWGDLAVVFGFWLLFSLLLVLALKYISFASFVEPTGRADVSKKLAKQKEAADAEPEGAKQGITLTWSNLDYDVGKRKLLTSIAGYVRPGMLLALMGASGAGKTTLLDVLARRKNTGKISGEVTLGGRPVDKFFHRYLGPLLRCISAVMSLTLCVRL